MGDLREFSIPLIQIENDHRIAALPEIFKRGAINQQQVHVLIVVVIKKTPRRYPQSGADG